MEKWQIPTRIAELRRIAQIHEASQSYTMRNFHSMPEIAQHAQRQQRLREFLAELDSVSGRSAMGGAATIPGGEKE
jgi:LmbE family N-acetylglucosaminyl deacetylase